jgi:hypothetical protein
MGSGFSGFKNFVISTAIKHAQVHQGLMFSLDMTDLAMVAGAFLRLHILTGDRVISITGEHTSSLTTRGKIYEDVTVSADGDIITPINRKRNTEHITNASFWSNPTITDFGTLLETTMAIAGKASTGAHVVEVDWELKPNSRYVIELENVENQVSMVHMSIIIHDEIDEHRIR